MKKWWLVGLMMLTPFYVYSAENTTNALAGRVEQSRMVVKAFMGELKHELKSALKAGGPVAGIEVCRQLAPAIAEAQSRKMGWTVARTSLKPRNPENRPDDWEAKVLKDFEVRQAAGEDPKKMEFYAQTQYQGKTVFRYMKAIPTAEKPCLACHGEKIKPAIASKLDESYPHDKARGYRAGDIRGAFSIIQPM
ncbi:Cytochrome c family protein [hydrothermal vent metagenome]|uniref:Cytochrome c family protein n=1 Tax=hydrothermal vent metagenome TaxID=652676 RepID=A0A3B1BH48_9ZZZZ